jgi:hypothetical protein
MHTSSPGVREVPTGNSRLCREPAREFDQEAEVERFFATVGTESHV